MLVDFYYLSLESKTGFLGLAINISKNTCDIMRWYSWLRVTWCGGACGYKVESHFRQKYAPNDDFTKRTTDSPLLSTYPLTHHLKYRQHGERTR